MDLSIIIVNWNTKELVADCVKSIIANTGNISFEIIVVDNGSEDRSVEALEMLKFNNLRIISNNKNLGFAKANNMGIKIAKGEYILLLNSDTEVKKGVIEKMVEFGKSRDDVGVVGAKLLNRDGSLQESVFNLPTLGRTIRQYWFGQKGLLDKLSPKGKQPVEVEAVVGAALLITPQAKEKVGGLSERYFMYFEDLDYCRRVRRVGLKVFYLPGAEVFHYHGASGRKITSGGDQWRRLVPSSKVYHGALLHYLIWFVMWTGQKFGKLMK